LRLREVIEANGESCLTALRMKVTFHTLASAD